MYHVQNSHYDRKSPWYIVGKCLWGTPPWGHTRGAMTYVQCCDIPTLCISLCFFPSCHIFLSKPLLYIFLTKIKTMCIRNYYNVGILNIPKTAHKQPVWWVTLELQDCIYLAILGENVSLIELLGKIRSCSSVVTLHLFSQGLSSILSTFLLSSVLSSPTFSFSLLHHLYLFQGYDFTPAKKVGKWPT